MRWDDDWLSVLRQRLPVVGQAVLVTVLRTQGHVPYEVGARMAVGIDWSADSLGGGWLEQQVCQYARHLLDSAQSMRCCESFALGDCPDYCCAGMVWLLFERLGGADLYWLELAWQARRQGLGLRRKLVLDSDLPVECTVLQEAPQGVHWLAAAGLLQDDLAAPRLTVVLCGAGHVGQALCCLQGALPVRVFWLDERADLFPATYPANVTVLPGGPELMASLPAYACWLVMTHSDQRDFDWIEQILLRNDARFIGLLGCGSKLASFNLRLIDRVPLGRIASIRCPLGVAGIDSKQPSAIAIAVAAQLLQQLGPA